MDTVLITWNFTNWLTVVLMSLIGFMLFSLAVNAFAKRAAKGNGDE